MVISQMDAGGFDLVILDGEASPTGGMGIAKQLKDEIDDCPPILVLTGRAGRRLAGQLVAGRGRGSPPDRPDPAGRRGGVAAAHASAVDPPRIILSPLPFRGTPTWLHGS